MNQQLWQAHLENLELRRQLREVKRHIVYRCVYCGNLTEATSGACAAHRDLPALDPDYAGRRP